MVTLKEYLWSNRFRMFSYEFADKVGVERRYLSAIVNGRYVPSVQLAKAIQKATDGEIKWNDLIDWCERTKAERATYQIDLTQKHTNI